MTKSPQKGLRLTKVNVNYPTPLDDWIASTFSRATLKTKTNLPHNQYPPHIQVTSTTTVNRRGKCLNTEKVPKCLLKIRREKAAVAET